MTVHKKLSAPVAMLSDNLRKGFTDRGVLEGSTQTLNMDAKQLNDFLDGYTTTVGEVTRPVTGEDIQAVSNFREDFKQASRVVGIDLGFEHFEKNPEADRFILETNLTDNLRYNSAVYRPGSEEEAGESGNDFTAMIDHGEVSADSKTISEHLASKRKAFTKAAAKK